MPHGFDPITAWHARCRCAAPGGQRIAVELGRGGAGVCCFERQVAARLDEALVRYLRAWVHNLVWAFGAARVTIDCDRKAFRQIEPAFAQGGEFQHQAALMSELYGQPFELLHGQVRMTPSDESASRVHFGPAKLGQHVGVDLGGSDAKVVALADGELRHHEKRDWQPRKFTAGERALEVIMDLIQSAMERADIRAVDGIGISSAGIVVDGRLRLSGIFGGMSRREFEAWIAPLAGRVSKRFGDAPTCLANDGDMTPLWAHVDMGLDRVLGLSLGTGLGAGFVDETGGLSGALCELGKVILDMSPDAPKHIYNHTRGPALHYCSQNAVFRLAERAGIRLDGFDLAAEKLRRVQALAASGDASAQRIFDAVGEYVAYAVAEFHTYFAMRNVVLVGRVAAGPTGERLLASAQATLEREFPWLAAQVRLHFPQAPHGMDAAIMREFGQAIAAAYWSSMCLHGAES